MTRIKDYLFFWRSIPAIFIYISLKEENKRLVDADIARMGLNPGKFALHKLLLHNFVFRRIFFVRVLRESIMKYRLIRWTYKPLESLEISAVTGNIGGGLKIYHGYSTIIFCNSMGEQCTIFQNVTIGRGKYINGINVPTIGRNVTIYAGAIIVGGIHIGDNAVIGAGAIVVKDIPDNAIVVSQPARVILH